MAETPSDIRWPPNDALDFDSSLDVMFDLRSRHFPEHTAQDLADPFVQLMALITAIRVHAFGRANHALLQLDPRYATSRRAILGQMEWMNRPLLSIQPSRGNVYGKLQSAPTVDTVYIPASSRMAQQSITDPNYSVDEEVATGSNIQVNTWTQTTPNGSATGPTLAASYPLSSQTMDVGYCIILGFEDLMFNQLEIGMNSNALTSGHAISWEYRNDETGDVDSVAESSGQLTFDVSTYLNDAGSSTQGLFVTITYIPTDTSETVEITSTTSTAVTSYLGQSVPSTSISDYEVFAEWRPIPDVVDGTSNLTGDGTVSWLITNLKSTTNDWVKDDVYGWAIRARATDPSEAGNLPDTYGMAKPVNTEGEWYVQAAITQGYRRQVSIGSTDGTVFQFLAVSGTPIEEPVADQAQLIEVGSDTDWTVVADFTTATSSSKYAIFREDPDDGWGIIFGDGTIGQLPNSSEAVKLTYRTGSSQPGDLSAGVSVKEVGGLGLVTDYVLYRGTSGYAVPECSDLSSTRRFRYGVLPQLALRAESAITVPELKTALSGGAPNRATFTTSDGRKPFSRAFYSVEGAGDRQYRMVVVGLESDDDGSVDSNDLTEAETWLNGTEIGVEIVGGHGPQNTQGIVTAFVPRVLLPTITLTVTTTEGVRAQAEAIIRNFFKPHARDENEEFRWEFGGEVPMAVLFGLLWAGVPNRTNMSISTTDGVTTYTTGSSVSLQRFELPTLDPSFDPNTHIIIST